MCMCMYIHVFIVHTCVHMYDTYGHVVGSSQETAGFGWDIRIVQYSDEASREESRSGEASAVSLHVVPLCEMI